MAGRSFSLTKFRSKAELIITGGPWALALPKRERSNLINFWFDGMFAAASDVFPLNYLTLYLLALSATGSQVGVFTALTSLAAAIFLLPGAIAEERFGSRQKITMAFGGIIARLAMLAMAIIPFLFKDQALIWAFIVLAVFRAASGNFAFSPWIALVNDIVPMEGRGRYFGSRNTAMTMATIIVTLLVGSALTYLNGVPGYQIMAVAAAILGLVSTYFYSRIKDPKENEIIEVKPAFSIKSFINDIRGNKNFVLFISIFALWNFTLFFSAPFFTVYMADGLHFSAVNIGSVFISNSVFRMLTQRKVGEMSDKYGEVKLLSISLFLIPILPFIWLYVTDLWHVIILNGISGMLWGVFELTSFNYLLHITPDKGRSRFSALYQVFVTLAASAGAAVGTLIFAKYGVFSTFTTSGAGRLITAVIFLIFARYLLKQKKDISAPA